MSGRGRGGPLDGGPMVRTPGSLYAEHSLRAS
jgi:hypothetical protein